MPTSPSLLQMHWPWLVLVAAAAVSAAGPGQRWSAPAPAPDARALRPVEDLEAAESDWVPLAAPCPTCRAQAQAGPLAPAAILDDDDLGLTPPKAPVVPRQIFSVSMVACSEQGNFEKSCTA